MAIDLDAAIEDAEAQIAELDRQREAAVTRLAELSHLREGRERSADCGNEPSPIAKARLFADLFRGREDVFAVRWENATKGRSGYSPRCANEWRPGICAKPKVRCGACQRQAFASLDVQQLLAHLRGQQVIGLYPLLADDSCRLLAIDLDGDSWRVDTKLLADVCQSLGVEPAVEVSVRQWRPRVVFFTDPVPAADARRLGFAILTGAMARGAAVGVESYDRLFPNQDVLPTGGFGNLIALPLQRSARHHGNTEFLDQQLKPYRDQWRYLASIRKITPINSPSSQETQTEIEPLPCVPPTISVIRRGGRRELCENDSPRPVRPSRSAQPSPTGSTSTARDSNPRSPTHYDASRRSPTRCSSSNNGCDYPSHGHHE